MSDNDLSAAYLSEHIGNKGEIPEWVTYVPQDKLRYLLRMERALDNPEKSDEFVETLLTVKSLATNEAIHEDDLTRVSAIKGISDNSVDATGYSMLLERVKPAAQTIIIKGPKGSGKTTKASDIIKKALDEGIIEKVMTNVQLSGFKGNKFEESEYDVRYSEIISDFLEFAKEPGEKLMLLDEISTVANNLGSNSEAQDIFPRVINALRKSEGGSCRIIGIGHQHRTDILASLRNNADGVLEAPNKLGEGIDRAIYYSSYDDYEQEDAEFKVRGLQDITDHPLFGFDDNSFATLEFNMDNPKEQIKRGQIRDDWREYQDNPNDDSGGDRLVFCAEDGCNSSSKQYDELLQDDVEYCPYHRQEDTDTEEQSSKNNQDMSDSEENVDEFAGNKDDHQF